MRNRHELLISLMQKEHEHNQRVRDAKQRANTKQEANRSVKERRQQSACVRRYYRDYQLQMRARMLKRRTREEKVSRNNCFACSGGFNDHVSVVPQKLKTIKNHRLT